MPSRVDVKHGNVDLESVFVALLLSTEWSLPWLQLAMEDHLVRRLSSIFMACPVCRSWTVSRDASIPLIWRLCRTSILGCAICQKHLLCCFLIFHWYIVHDRQNSFFCHAVFRDHLLDSFPKLKLAFTVYALMSMSAAEITELIYSFWQSTVYGRACCRSLLWRLLPVAASTSC